MADADGNLCGQTIDAQYFIEHCIGRGGMGIVWRARLIESKRLVALKTLRYSTAPSRDVLRRFLREARATAAVESPNVVRVLDVNLEYVHQGTELPFIAMELLEGRNFSDYLDVRQHIEPAELVWLMQQVSHGLLLAHRRGIVHRDLKPANVFLAEGSDGNIVVKLCDFGIAKLQGTAAIELAETGTLSTETGMVFGTPRYMAPEQLRRSAREGPATDQWAFALIAYRSLTGRNYFESARTAAELILAIVHEPLPAPSGLSTRIPSAFDQWFMRSCSREPATRFPDVSAQQAALEHALGSPVPVPLDLLGIASLNASQAMLGPIESIRDGAMKNSMAHPGKDRKWLRLTIFYFGLGVASLLSVLGIGLVRGYLRTEQPAIPLLRHETTVFSVSTRIDRAARQIQIARFEQAPGANSAPTPKRNAKQTSRPNPSRSDVGEPLLPRGASCTRSSQCADKICAAEVCQ